MVPGGGDSVVVDRHHLNHIGAMNVRRAGIVALVDIAVKKDNDAEVLLRYIAMADVVTGLVVCRKRKQSTRDRRSCPVLAPSWCGQLGWVAPPVWRRCGLEEALSMPSGDKIAANNKPHPQARTIASRGAIH